VCVCVCVFVCVCVCVCVCVFVFVCFCVDFQFARVVNVAFVAFKLNVLSVVPLLPPSVASFNVLCIVSNVAFVAFQLNVVCVVCVFVRVRVSCGLCPCFFPCLFLALRIVRGVLQCVAVRCSAMQCVACRCIALSFVRTCESDADVLSASHQCVCVFARVRVCVWGGRGV